MRALYYTDRIVAEGAAAVAHAAFAAGRIEIDNTTCFIISGCSVDMKQFTRIVNGEPVEVGELVVGETHVA
jgi:threonine dehydratase